MASGADLRIMIGWRAAAAATHNATATLSGAATRWLIFGHLTIALLLSISTSDGRDAQREAQTRRKTPGLFRGSIFARCLPIDSVQISAR